MEAPPQLFCASPIPLQSPSILLNQKIILLRWYHEPDHAFFGGFGLFFRHGVSLLSFQFNHSSSKINIVFFTSKIKTFMYEPKQDKRRLSVSPEMQRQCENAECRLEIRRLPYLIDSDILTGKYRRR